MDPAAALDPVPKCFTVRSLVNQIHAGLIQRDRIRTCQNPDDSVYNLQLLCKSLSK